MNSIDLGSKKTGYAFDLRFFTEGTGPEKNCYDEMDKHMWSEENIGPKENKKIPQYSRLYMTACVSGFHEVPDNVSWIGTMRHENLSESEQEFQKRKEFIEYLKNDLNRVVRKFAKRVYEMLQ